MGDKRLRKMDCLWTIFIISGYVQGLMIRGPLDLPATPYVNELHHTDTNTYNEHHHTNTNRVSSIDESHDLEGVLNGIEAAAAKYETSASSPRKKRSTIFRCAPDYNNCVRSSIFRCAPDYNNCDLHNLEDACLRRYNRCILRQRYTLTL